MHRLLSYKGYVFPEVRREDAAVLNPSDVRKRLYCVVAPLNPGRISNRQTKWKRRRRQPSRPSSKSLFEEGAQKIYKRQTD